ncbi:MAG: selenocysteine-specific translation elongation factor [Thermoanaerobaculia bacterium]|nr:selenocysteine-specific translation elongation factor [Thermoanaerobaculia bacterium]
MRRVLVGTAGHIDHGKSALVKALTGTDPDRLPEEKARGITIDLGFAHAAWDDTMFSFVDVPGHEKFVKTMVAGAQGVDLVLFVVASDDSVMPQTREHLDILKLLGVSSGVIARTKSDLSDSETGALVEEEIRALVKGSFLANAPLVAVSAVTGAGLDALRAALTRAARGLVREDRTKRVPRLFLDRAFTMKGFGPVVTGTLDGGRLTALDTLTLFPEQHDVRVRRIEVHGEERKEAWAGERTSLNLAGVERLALRRGQALAARGGLEPSSILTAEVTWLPSMKSPLGDGARLRVHLGTADIAGRVHLLGAGSAKDSPREQAFLPGSSGFAQITLESPLPARPGDRFVLRRPSPVETIGGGRVLDAGRPRLRRRSGADASHLTQVLSVLSAGDERDLADLFLLEAGPAGLTAARLGVRLGIPASATAGLLDALSSSGRALRIAPALHAHAGTASSLAERAAAAFAERRKSGGVSVSFAKSEFAERLGRALSPAAVDGWIAVLLAGKKIALDGDRVVPPGAKAADLAGDSASFAAKIAEGFRAAGFEPPHPHELARALGTKPAVVEGLVSHLVKSGTLVRLSPDLVVHRDVALAAEKKLDTVRGQTLSVAGFRDLLGLTRKTLIPLLEYFDAKKKTRRMGDVRRVE